MTEWTGTAFNCPPDGNEILLRHSQFSEPGGTVKECNNGDITARSMPVVEDNCYTSELSVRASSALNGRTICCDGMQIIGNATMTIISGMLHNYSALLWSVMIMIFITIMVC